MTCENCAARVAGALNAMGGTWAEVDLAAGTARLRSEGAIDEVACRKALEDTGYELVSVRCELGEHDRRRLNRMTGLPA